MAPLAAGMRSGFNQLCSLAPGLCNLVVTLRPSALRRYNPNVPVRDGEYPVYNW